MNNIPINFKNRERETKCKNCNAEETMQHIWKAVQGKHTNPY